MSLHPELLAAIGHEFGDRLAAPPQLTQDALIVPLPGGTTLTVRYAARNAYSLRWQVPGGGGILDMGIDTAPVHPAAGTYPNHLHLPNGRVVADPLTSPDAAPAANVAAVVSALLADPRLSSLTA